MGENFFSEATIEEVALSTGGRIGLPVRYYEWSWMNALFPAPSHQGATALTLKKIEASSRYAGHSHGCPNHKVCIFCSFHSLNLIKLQPEFCGVISNIPIEKH